MKEIHLNTILKILKVDFKKFISIVIGLNIILIGYSFIMPQTYSSELTIMPPKSSSGGGGLSSFLQNLGGGALSLGGIGEDDQSKLFADVLKSRNVSQKIISELELDTLDFFKELSDLALNAEVSRILETKVEKSGIIKLNCNFSTTYFANQEEIEFVKKLVKEITNSFAKSLDEILKEKNNSSAKQSRLYIDGEINKYRIKLDSISAELQNFQEEHKILEIEEQTKAVVTQAIEIGTQLIEYENELNLAMIQMNPNSNQVQVLRNQVEMIKKQAKRIQEGGLNDDGFSLPLSKVPELARRFTEIYRDREIIEKVLLYLETQKHQEMIQEEKDVPVIEILDYAYEPEIRSSPKRSLMLLIGTIIFAIVAFIYIIISAYYKGRL